MDKIRNVCRSSHSSRVVWVNLKKVRREAFWIELSWTRSEEVLSLAFIVQSSWLSHKVSYQLFQRKRQTVLSSLVKRAWCLWDVLEPQDIPTWLKGWDLRLSGDPRLSLWSQWAGQWVLLNWIPVTVFYSLRTWWYWWYLVFGFCFSVFLVSR